MSDLGPALYRKLFLIRASEEAIRERYPEDEMKTPMHMSFGEEAIAAGICQALAREDRVFTSYRSHAIYLAKTDDAEGFFAELYARETSPVLGRGGSMHLCHPEAGFMGASAIVASHIPVAVGAAHANRIQDNGRVVAVFFGDGAVDEGVFWESLNLACLKRLPVLFVCEDNGFAVHTPVEARRGYDALLPLVRGFKCPVLASDSTDVEELHGLANQALQAMRDGGGPCFMELKYYRYLEHVGIQTDFEAGYRPVEAFEAWRQRDPIHAQRARLLERGVPLADLEALEAEVRARVSASLEGAREAALSPVSVHDEGVYR